MAEREDIQGLIAQVLEVIPADVLRREVNRMMQSTIQALGRVQKLLATPPGEDVDAAELQAMGEISRRWLDTASHDGESGMRFIAAILLDDFLPTPEGVEVLRRAGLPGLATLAGVVGDYRGPGRQAIQSEVLNKKVDALEHPQAAAIDVDTIELIHGIERQQDGFITFCRKVRGEGHQDLAGVKVAELRQWLPELLPWLVRDAYFTVNAAFKGGMGKNRITGLPDTRVFVRGKYDGTIRREARLRYLNACYVDLDCYKSGLQWSDGVGVVLRAQDENIIPPPSIIVRSGRGIYLLWLLSSEREGAQQRAFASEVVLYKQINRALIATLNNYEPRLRADSQAADAARILRVPGSEHTKAQQPVVAQVQVVAGGRVPVFTLKELAAFYGIPVTPQLPERSSTYLRPIKKRGSCPARRRGAIATGHRRLSDLHAITQHRGGIAQGKRFVSLRYLCQFARAAGYTLSDIESMAAEFAKTCRPPYPSDDDDVQVVEIVKGVWIEKRGRVLNNDSIAKFFQVTPELAEELNLQSIIPEAVKDARAAEPSPREQAQVARREIIREIVARHPGIRPSLRAIGAELDAADLHAAKDTISRDLKAVLGSQ